MPSVDLSEKTLYCLRMMRLGRWVAGALPEPYFARVPARAVLIYLHSFLVFVPELNNRADTKAPSKQEVRKSIARLRKDYRGYYFDVRTGIAAHRRPHSPLDDIDLWNSVDAPALDILIDDSLDLYHRLETVSRPPLQPYADASPYGEGSLATTLAGLSHHQGVEIGVDTVGLARPNTVAMIAVNSVGKAAQRVVSVNEMIGATASLLRASQSYDDVQRLGKAMLVTEVVNLFDLLFVRADTETEGSFQQLARSANHAGVAVLDDLESRIDWTEHAAMRKVRNTIGAHVNPPDPLADLVQDLDAITLDGILPGVDEIVQTFFRACAMEPSPSLITLHGQRSRGSIATVADSGELRDF